MTIGSAESLRAVMMKAICVQRIKDPPIGAEKF
jgi:hypothetical protein